MLDRILDRVVILTLTMILASFRQLGADETVTLSPQSETIIPAAATTPIVEFQIPRSAFAVLEADRWTKNRFWLVVGGIGISALLAIGTGFYVRKHLRQKRRDPFPPSYEEKALSTILPAP